MIKQNRLTSLKQIAASLGVAGFVALSSLPATAIPQPNLVNLANLSIESNPTQITWSKALSVGKSYVFGRKFKKRLFCRWRDRRST